MYTYFQSAQSRLYRNVFIIKLTKLPVTERYPNVCLFFKGGGTVPNTLTTPCRATSNVRRLTSFLRSLIFTSNFHFTPTDTLRYVSDTTPALFHTPEKDQRVAERQRSLKNSSVRSSPLFEFNRHERQRESLLPIFKMTPHMNQNAILASLKSQKSFIGSSAPTNVRSSFYPRITYVPILFQGNLSNQPAGVTPLHSSSHIHQPQQQHTILSTHTYNRENILAAEALLSLVSDQRVLQSTNQGNCCVQMQSPASEPMQSEHSQRHQDEKLQCYISRVVRSCGKHDNRTSTAVAATTSATTRSKVPECDVCGKTFSHNSNLRRHMLVHTQIRRFKCNDCGKVNIPAVHKICQIMYCISLHSVVHLMKNNT